MSVTFSRRRLLAAATLTAGGAVTGCTGGDSARTPTPSPPPESLDPLEPILTGALALVAAYDRAAEFFPELATRLAPLREQSAEHVLALQLALAVPTMTPPSPAVSTGTSAGSGTGLPTGHPGTSPTSAPGASPPVDPAAALAGLRARLGAIRSATGQLCLTTTAERAPLIGSLTAATACHDLLLA